MSIFTNKFFSSAGQKERLRNVAETVKSAFDFNKNTKVVANVKSPTLKKALEITSNNPYATAGVATAGVMAGKALLRANTIASTLSTGSSASKGASVGSSLLKNKYLVGGVVGLAGGALLSGNLRGGGSTPQTVTPTQTNEPTQNTIQEPTQDNRTWIDQRNYSRTLIRDSPNAQVSQTPSNILTPSQISNQQPTQDFTPTQETTASASNNNLLIPALIIGGSLFLKK